ncbi:MAG: hypothetical protein ACLFNT_10705 [Spirochaetales bacterium]
MSIYQIVVNLENEPGRLFVISDRLAKAGVNIRLLTVSGEGAHGALRMVVDDERKARNELMALDVPARLEPVTAVRFEDRPGGLAALLKPLLHERINVTQVHAQSDVPPYALAVLAAADAQRAEVVLREHGYAPLSSAELWESRS